MSKTLFLKSVSYSYIRQIITLLTGVISLPLLLNYFGTETYGIWVLVVGLTGYLNTISFGIPSAMTTLVAKSSHLQEKYLLLKKSVKILFFISLSILSVFISVLYFNDSWIVDFLGNIDSSLIGITKSLFIVFVIITLVKTPFDLYIQFFIGMNKVYISELYRIFATLVNFIAVVIAVYFHIEILNFALLWLGGQLLINIIAAVHVVTKYMHIGQEKSVYNSIQYETILKSGFSFFQVGAAATIVWSTDNLVISHFLSPESVTPYSIGFKIFTYIFLFSAIINGVIGPMYGNAFAKNDWGSIQKYTMMIHKVLPVFGAIAWVFLILFSKDIIILWTGKSDAYGGYLLAFSLGLYGYVLSYLNTYATLVYSLNYANKTVHIAWIEAVLNFIFSVILIQYFGIGGVALGTALAALSVSIILPKKIKEITNDKIIYNFDYTKKHFIYLTIPFIVLSVCIVEFSLFIRVVIFAFMSILYISLNWNFLSMNDKNIVINLLRKRTIV